jgi:geranylgeranyl pyrophosphate synthase
LDKLEHKWRLIEEELIQIEKRLRQIVETAGPEINEVGDYIFNGTGKRIRPTLFLIAAYNSRQSLSPLLDAAVAFELMHTASLLHDDVIDQALTRRGKDAVHVRWNNKISVLSGDFLLSQVFKILVDYRDWRLMDIVIDIAQNMAEGEVEQAFADTQSTDLEERYFQWIGKKSASFFAGCCKAGSLLAGDNLEEQSKWAEFGYNLGIAFQLIDDLLDYTGEGGVTGKPLYGDLNNRVITLPLIRTLNSSHIDRGEGSIKHLFQDQFISGREIRDAAQAVLEGDGPAYTYSKAEEYTKKAAAVINKLNPANQDKKNLLEELTRDILLRKK